MSCNIRSCDTKNCDLTISRANFWKIFKNYRNDLPEWSFVDEVIDKSWDRDEIKEKLPETISLKKLSWMYMGSDASFEEVLLKGIIPLLKGEAELIYHYEGGGSIGLLIKDGKYKLCRTEIRILDEGVSWK